MVLPALGISEASVTTIYKHMYILAGTHELPASGASNYEGWQGAFNYVQRHLTMSGSDTFLICIFPQMGNLHLWSLHVRVKQAQRTVCRRAPEHVLLFHTCDANWRIVNITRDPRIHDGA